MAMGGMVQRFSEGSDNDGVEPGDETPSGLVQAIESLQGNMTAQQAAALYGPNFVERARQAALKRMEAYPVPKFEKVLEEKIPLYQKLLGQDKSLTQSQMLFDVAKAGLAFAGNVDPRTGQPLRGSFAARLAGAASELPEKIGARASEAEKMAQQIKLLGIQAAEKEVSSARTEALAREKSLADFFGKLVPKTGTVSKPVIREIGGEIRVFDQSKGGDITNPADWVSLGKKPASGYTDADYNQFMTDYAPAILDGTATAQQKLLFLSAVNHYTQVGFVPTTRTEKNPTTGETFVVQTYMQVPGKVLDPVQQRAVNKLRSEMGKDFNSIFRSSAAITPDTTPQEPATTTGGTTAPATTSPVTGGRVVTPATSGTAAPAAASTTAQGTTITPLFRQPSAQSTVNFKFGIQQTGLTPQQAMVSGSFMPNLMDVAYQGIGIISVPAAAVTRFPALGQFAGAEQQATSFIEQSIPIFKRALIDADKTTVTELTQKTENELDRLLPRAISNPTAYGRDLLSLDTALATREQLLKQKIDNPDINIELKKSYRDRLADVQNARDLLGVKDTPRFTNIKEIESFRRSVPGKTPLYFYFLPDQETMKTLDKNDLRKIRENPFLRIQR
jgi:predicted aconitase with swiveling domain